MEAAGYGDPGEARQGSAANQLRAAAPLVMARLRVAYVRSSPERTLSIALLRMPMTASSDTERASRAIEPASSAEAIATELMFWLVMYSIALSTTAPAWLKSAGGTLVVFGHGGLP